MLKVKKNLFHINNTTSVQLPFRQKILALVRILTLIMENAHLVRKRSEFRTKVRNFEKLVKMLEKTPIFLKKLNFEKKRKKN